MRQVLVNPFQRKCMLSESGPDGRLGELVRRIRNHGNAYPVDGAEKALDEAQATREPIYRLLYFAMDGPGRAVEDLPAQPVGEGEAGDGSRNSEEEGEEHHGVAAGEVEKVLPVLWLRREFARRDGLSTYGTVASSIAIGSLGCR